MDYSVRHAKTPTTLASGEVFIFLNPDQRMVNSSMACELNQCRGSQTACSSNRGHARGLAVC